MFLLVILLLLCWGLISNGLYFSQNLYPIFITLTILLVLYMLYGFLRGKWKEIVSIQSLLIMPILYLVTMFFSVESVQGTIGQAFKWLFYCGFFYLLTIVSKEKDVFKKVLLGFIYFTVISTLSVLIGIFHSDGFVMVLNQRVSGLGERLGGFMQYPNAFAALVASLIMYLLMTILAEEGEKWRLANAIPLPILFTFLLMTESRGTWAIFAVTWILSFLFVKKETQFIYVIHSISTFILGAITYFFMIYDKTLKINKIEWIVLIIVSTGIVFITRRTLKLATPDWLKTWYLPAVLVVMSILTLLDLHFKGLLYRTLPDVLQRRLSMGAGTFSDRVVYWKDALSYPSDFLLTGLGGEGWKYYMYRVQSGPYLTSELHNGYLNLLLELGIIGFAIILAALGWILFNMIKAKSIYTLPLVILLLSGLIDFSLSFGIIMMLGILYIAIEVTNWKRNTIFSLEKIKLVSTILFILLLSIASFKMVSFQKAERYFQQALLENNESQQALLLKEAIRLNPYDSNYRIQAISNQEISHKEKILKDGLEYEQHQARLLYEYANLLNENGKTEQGLKCYKLSFKNDRFDIHKYEDYMEKMAANAEHSNGKEKKLFLKQVLQSYETAENLEKTMNKQVMNQRGFHITKKMRKLYQEFKS